MDIIKTSIHRINHLSEEVIEIQITKDHDSLNEYMKNLFLEIEETQSKRLFTFQQEESKIRSAINFMLNNDFEKGSKINAKRLLDVEIKAQKQIEKLNIKIQKGIFIQSHLKDSNNKAKIVLTKADHSQFLDETELTFRDGLPSRRKIFKAIIISFDQSCVESIHICDTNSSMAAYWWRDFLELKPVYTDSYNTKTSLDIIDTKVFNPIKNKFKADHTTLRNSAIGYFRNHDEFDIDGFVDHVFTNYMPVDKALDIGQLSDKVKELPQKFNFDARFNIEKAEIIQRRVKETMKLHDSVDLVLNDHIDNLSDIIQPWEDDEGTKYIKIKSDEGYARFRCRDKNEQ
ncbi:hypothetical protein IQ225_07675 [Synechocystis salina LEGE 06155]|nr:hypothetical protein [Synechocystis salina LEGE 06155]